MKKRSRFMAGKALKDVTNLNRCSACGNVKRAHLLCPYCVKGRSLVNWQFRCGFANIDPQILRICGWGRREALEMKQCRKQKYRVSRIGLGSISGAASLYCF